MDDATETSYWCYMCSRSVNPEIEGEIIKCNFCEGGFVEEMDNNNNNNNNNAPQDSVTTNNDHPQAADSLWAPILIGMMNNLRESESNVEDEENDNDDDEDEDEDEEEENNDREINVDRQFEAIMSRRRSHSAAILDLLQGIRAGLSVESETNEDNPDTTELVVLINSFNQRLRIQEADDANSVPSGSLGDYFIGPGFEMLLQRLAENDPNNRFGTPPATKEAVESLAVVKIEESLLQCTVCLDDFEIGIDAKEMPCKHKFHSECLLPWLELHSSCPVCRYLLPTADDDDDEAKTDTETSRNDDSNDDISNASMENNGSSVDSSSINSSAN